MFLHFRICLFEEGYTPAATMIGYDFRSVRRRRNQQQPQIDKVITTAASTRLLKPYTFSSKNKQEEAEEEDAPELLRDSSSLEEFHQKTKTKKNKKNHRTKKSCQKSRNAFQERKKDIQNFTLKNRQKLHKKFICGRTTSTTTAHRAMLQIKHARET
jgi:hypothetical protein